MKPDSINPLELHIKDCITDGLVFDFDYRYGDEGIKKPVNPRGDGSNVTVMREISGHGNNVNIVNYNNNIALINEGVEFKYPERYCGLQTDFKLPLTDNFTVQVKAKFYVTTASSTFHLITQTAANSSPNIFCFGIHYNASQLRVFNGAGSNFYPAFPQEQRALTNVFTIVRRNGRFVVYLNGTQTGEAATFITLDDAPMCIGSLTNPGSFNANSFTGVINNVLVYDRALTNDEILFNQGPLMAVSL